MTRILVGYDGSEHAVGAVRWAVADAARRGAALEVLESWHEPVFSNTSIVDAWLDPLGEERRERERFEAAITEIVADYPEVAVTTTLVSEGPALALVALSSSVDLVVVGARGRGGFTGLLLGSVSQRVAWKATSSVVVVRGDIDRTGPVVVGVDGTAASRDALSWAAAEAGRRDETLRVVMAWHPLAPLGPNGRTAPQASYADLDADGVLHATIARTLDRDHGLTIEAEVVRESASKAIIDRSQDASLLVIGPGSSSTVTGRFGGSVCAQMLQHAPGPLVIVRHQH